MIVGKRISNRYKIEKLIGGGGMSNVYLAHDIILNRDVAVKILRYDLTNEEELHRRFHREALSATSLTHPNIVSIYDVGEDGDMHYIVMEFIKGKTLKQYIQEFSPLSPARSVHIMKQLTSAMTHAHDNGIIHRDIKPQNILMDEAGNVKITDFGIATTLSATSYTQTNSVLGTVHYLSPEQARGGTASKKSDIYALGIVLYELLTGELPFSGESAVSIALKHLQSETPSVRAFDASIPQSLENIVLKATAKDPAHRYQSTEEMEEDLETALSVSRSNEEKFQLPIDDEATRLIPIIKEPKPVREPIMIPKQPTPVTEKPSTAVPEKKRKKKWPIIVGTLIVLVILAVIAINMLTPNKITVPDVGNLTIEEAKLSIEKAGFVVGDQEERNSEDIEAGKVIETKPSAGLDRVKGTSIDLIVSIGEDTDEMVDYVGKQSEQIVPILEQTGFEVTVEEVFSTLQKGTIVEQEPEAGIEITAKNTNVIFKVSKGEELQELVEIKSLVGFNETNRKEYERSSGLTISVASEDYSNSVPVGSVISQKPTAGRKVEAGSKVTVVISKGPVAKKEKFYTKTIEIPYEPLEEGMEQTVVVHIQDKTHMMADSIDSFTITEPTSYTLEFLIVEGEKAAYQIFRDNIMIENEIIPYDTPE